MSGIYAASGQYLTCGMSGISIPTNYNFPMTQGTGVAGDWTPQVTKELREQIEQCVDDEAMFAIIEEEKDRVPNFGFDPNPTQTSGVATGGYIGGSGSGYIPANLPKLQSMQVSGDVYATKKKYGLFDWFLPVGT